MASNRRADYSRPRRPQNPTLRERDFRILETLYIFGGRLARRQIDRLFFSGKGRSQVRDRLRQLFYGHYIKLLGPEQNDRIPAKEVICVLDKRGARELAEEIYKVPVRELGYSGKFRWGAVRHDLKRWDFRIQVQLGCEALAEVYLERWIEEEQMYSWGDEIGYVALGGEKKKKTIVPDDFFSLKVPSLTKPNQEEALAFLVEVDTSNHYRPRFHEEKLLAGAYYLGSDIYQKRFGIHYGRWLILATGEQSMNNMRSRAAELLPAKAKGRFYFTTFERVLTVTPVETLLEPVWLMCDRSTPTSLVPPKFLAGSLH